MITRHILPLLSAVSVLLVSCGGGGSTDSQVMNDPVDSLVDDQIAFIGSRSAAQARYRVTLENFWGVEDFPQGFPDNATYRWLAEPRIM